MSDTQDIERFHNMLPSQDDVEVGKEYLVPTTLVRQARGGGERYKAICVEVKEKEIEVDESPHKHSEGME